MNYEIILKKHKIMEIELLSVTLLVLQTAYQFLHVHRK